MKKLKNILYVIVLLGFVVNSCKKPERDNYWDEKAYYDPDSWAPKNLKLTVNDLSSITLSWEQVAPVEGFRVERKTGDGAWELVTGSVDGSQRQYVDKNVALPAANVYRVYAFAGKNTSSFAEALVGLPTVTTAEITNITTTTAISGGNITSNGGSNITARGVVWSTTENPTVLNNEGSINNGTGSGSFTSQITGLNPANTYYVRAYAINSAGTSYGSQVSFITSVGNPPTVITASITNIIASTAIGGGNVTSQGDTPVTQRGVCWSASPDPTTSNNITNDGSGTGAFTSQLIGFDPGVTYYVRAYAINSAGTSYGSQISFFEMVFNEVTNPATGKNWMDRNMGAVRVAQSSTDDQAYGDLYQWGRMADGHEKRNSGTTSTLSSSDTPGHGDFITISSSPFDWRSPQNDNLWQGVDGTNNPCPAGYRLPTEAEWEEERQSWSSDNSIGAYNSSLKLPVAGYRYLSNGSLDYIGSHGLYWSATVVGPSARNLYFDSSNTNINYYSRGYGVSVRCIKD